jgi:Glycosyltransferase family 87
VTRDRAKVTAAVLWVLAIAVTIPLVLERYDVGNVSGTDFNVWLSAARGVADGHSPYLVKLFVYPPPIALLLAPFSHGDHVHLWKVWTALELAALLVGVLAFVFEVAPRLRSGQKPVLFALCSVTVLNFWPVTVGLRLGQTDAFVFAVLLLSGLMSSRARVVGRSVLLGVGGLLKAWPAGIGFVLLQRGLKRRRDAIVSFAVTLLLAPVLVVVVGGRSGISDFFKNNYDARTQPLTSDSVWGAPKLLFSHSGIGRPLLVSPLLRYGVTAILLVWVVGLVVVALRTSGNTSMCLWNVTLCVVLLQPVSHTTYTLYGLPILWLWASRVLMRAPRWDAREIAPAVVLLVWWALHTRAWPGPTLEEISAARYCIVFFANLIACTVSVVAARLVAGDELGVEAEQIDRRLARA